MNYPLENIYRREAGEGDNLLVFIHAFPVNSRLFEDIMTDMIPSDWQVILPDLPGFGKSPVDQDRDKWTMEELALLIDSILPTVKGKLVIGGISMGGYITMAHAKQFTGKADAYILSNTRDGADEDGGEGRRQVVSKIQGGGRDEYLQEQLLPRVLGKTSLQKRPEIVERTKKLFETAADQAIIQSMRGMAQREDSREFLTTVDVPILIICGDEDELTGPEISQSMAQSYQQATLKIIPKSGHFSILEEPHEYAKVVNDFLNGLS